LAARLALEAIAVLYGERERKKKRLFFLSPSLECDLRLFVLPSNVEREETSSPERSHRHQTYLEVVAAEQRRLGVANIFKAKKEKKSEKNGFFLLFLFFPIHLSFFSLWSLSHQPGP
jgi:hypothetical protein